MKAEMLATEFFNPSPAQYTRFSAIFRSNSLNLRDIPEFYLFRGVRSGGRWGRLSGRLPGGLSTPLSTPLR